jgi:tetratricopeptide (TPR) repeat protein
VELFVERARAARPGFELNDDNAAAVAAICRRVDGLPLAIELAAARVNVLSPSQILERLDHRLTLLAGSRRDVTDRQRTLRGAIDWSHDLLSEEEKAGFRRFAAFAGGADLDAALAVLDPDGALSVDPIDLLGALVGRSLLRSADESGEQRFSMLETIREYALEKLVESGEEAEVCQRHCSFYAALADGAREVLFAPDRDARLDKLDREMPNFRAAIEWTLRRDDAATGARFANGLKEFWRTRSHLAEARRLLDAMLEVALKVGDDRARADILAAAAELASWATAYDRSLELGREHLELLEKLGDRPGMGAAYQNAGWGTLMAAPEEARRYFEQSVEIAREIDDQHLLIGASQGLGIALLRLGDVDGARTAALLTLDSDGAGQDRYTNLYNYLTLGAVDLHEGSFPAAARSFREALNRARDASSDVGMIVVLDAVSHVAIETGDLPVAVKLYCVADRVRREIGGAPAAALMGWATTIYAARERDSAAANAAAEASLSMTIDDAVALADEFLTKAESA